MVLSRQFNPEVPACRMCKRFLYSLACLFLIISAREVHASRLLEILDLSPIVVEGDVLAIPVRCLDPDSRRNPPEVVTLQLDGRDDLEGLVTWVGMELDRLVRPGESSWTRPMAILRAIPFPEGARQRALATGYILCPAPLGYRGTIRLGRQVIQPRWLRPLPEPIGPPMPAAVGPEWPALDDPGSWWRWALLAEASGGTPPPFSGSVREQLLARHGAGLWRAGLRRLHGRSPGTAAELRELLVARCTTSDRRDVAAWITDSTELKVLLDLMLDTRRDEMLVVRSVLSYLDARFPMIAWVELETGSRARIALANPTDGEQIMRLQWLEGDPIPSASVVPSGQVVEVNVDRPDLAGLRPTPGPGFEAPTNDIVLSLGRMQERLRFSAERLVARPPGIQFGPFLLPMGLSDAWSGREHSTPPEWGTAVILRKRSGSWELFLECRRPVAGKGGDDLVEIHLGPPETPIRVIRVASDGTIGFSPEGARFQGATARVKVFEDRWRSIVRLDPVLVEAASAVGEPQTLQIGLRRLRDGQLFSVAGAAVPPWSSAPPIYLVDLSEWGEILPSASSPTSSDDASVYSDP